MMHIGLVVLVPFGLLTLSACATTPPISVNYYLTKTELNVKLIQTVGCNAANDRTILTSPIIKVIHRADYQHGVQTFEAWKLNKSLANSDVKFTFFSDGRLKGTDTVSTGKGKDVFETTIGLATSVAARIQKGKKPPPHPCDLIRLRGGKNKTITLTHSGKFTVVDQNPALDVVSLQLVDSIGGTGTPQTLNPDNATRLHKSAINGKFPGYLPNVTFSVLDAIRVSPAVTMRDDVSAKLPLMLRQPKPTKFSINSGGSVVWEGYRLIANLGEKYPLPVPKAAIFGKQTFKLVLEESGAINTVQYASETGVNDSLGTANSLVNALEGRSAKEKAAEYSSEADLIAAQQRLMLCQNDPKECDYSY